MFIKQLFDVVRNLLRIKCGNKFYFGAEQIRPMVILNLGGICTRNMGPINEWWTTGFDGGENPVVGFSTAFAEYILSSPSEAYKPFWDAVADKVQLSKVVIEFLKDATEKEEMPTYEDLVNRIQVSGVLAEHWANRDVSFTIMKWFESFVDSYFLKNSQSW